MVSVYQMENSHLQIYPHRPDLTIKSQAEHYAGCKNGRGPTHIAAFLAGAKFFAKLLRNGNFTADELAKV